MTDTMLGELRARFRETTRERLDEMAALLAALEADPRDAESLQQLAKHFHALAGMGGTYGFPRVSELGDEAEAEMLPLVRSRAAVASSSIARWRSLVADIMREVRRRGSSPAVPSIGGCSSFTARRILAVEDDATTGALIRGFLGAAGYDVQICREAAEFESMLFAFEPDLVLMDVQIAPDVSGHDLVRYVRQSERFATLPVIIVTSDSQRRAILDSANAGADLFVAKPIDWDVLLSQIGACVARDRRA